MNSDLVSRLSKVKDPRPHKNKLICFDPSTLARHSLCSIRVLDWPSRAYPCLVHGKQSGIFCAAVGKGWVSPPVGLGRDFHRAVQVRWFRAGSADCEGGSY